MSTTTVPRWSPVLDDPRALDGAASVLVVGLCESADLHEALQRPALAHLTPFLLELTLGIEIELARFERVVRAASVGTRLVLIGGESQVVLARRAALRIGAVPAEIFCEVTDRALQGEVAERRIYCVHCRAVHTDRVEVGDLSTCPCCRRSLLVYYHHSTNTAAYLGFQADAEDAR